MNDMVHIHPDLIVPADRLKKGAMYIRFTNSVTQRRVPVEDIFVGPLFFMTSVYLSNIKIFPEDQKFDPYIIFYDGDTLPVNGVHFSDYIVFVEGRVQRNY